MKIAILGSVLLKKAIDCLDNKKIQSVVYAPKLSIAALPPIESGLAKNYISGIDVNAFTRGILVRDFEKTFLDEIKKVKPDVLLIDCLDDPTDLLENPETQTIITKSNYITKLDLERIGIANWNTVTRDSEAGWKYWKKGLDHLFNAMPAETKIVLIKTFQPEQYNKESIAVRYSERRLQQILKNNSIIERSYQSILERINCETIDISPDTLISNTPESSGFNPYDVPDEITQHIATEVARLLKISSSVVPPVKTRTEALFDLFGAVLDHDLPSISDLHAMGKQYLKTGDVERARKTERLISLLKNSSVPLTVELGKSKFGYGGIGVVIHAQCKIGDYVNIGTNVTLGGGKKQVDSSGKTRKIPYIEDRVYIATGAKIIGGITIGKHSIIGANAVVTTDVPPYSVVAGNPAKVIATITPENLSRYASYLYKGMSAQDAARLMFP